MKVIADFESGAYTFLSNFYPAEISHRGIAFPTVEHAYQAAKSKSLEDRLAITAAKTPAQAKKLGRKLKIRDDWEEIKVGVMLKLLRRKFRDPKLKRMLLNTHDAILVEGNWWNDRFWGQHVRKGSGHQPEEGETPGLNMLGVLLMIVRQELGSGFD